MGSQSSKKIVDKEVVTPQYIENCKNEVENWHTFSAKTVKNVFEDSLSHAGLDKYVRDGILKRILDIIRRLSGFIACGLGAFFDLIQGYSGNKAPREMANEQFTELFKDLEDFENTYRDVLSKLNDQGGNLFSIVVTLIVAFLRAIINWIKWFFQKIGEFVGSCVDFIKKAFRSLFEKTNDLEKGVQKTEWLEKGAQKTGDLEKSVREKAIPA